MTTNIAIFYYSSTGNVYQLARAVEAGAHQAGAQVRLRRAAELAPQSVIDGVPAWREHASQTADVPVATLEDLEWADGYVFGTPTRYGNVAAQLRQFIDTTSEPWSRGVMADKPISGFTCSGSPHGGQETTLLSMYTVFMHWGSLIVPQGYTDEVVDSAGGNPYGVSCLDDGNGPTPEAIQAARYQGQRVTGFATLLANNRQTTLISGPAR